MGTSKDSEKHQSTAGLVWNTGQWCGRSFIIDDNSSNWQCSACLAKSAQDNAHDNEHLTRMSAWAIIPQPRLERGYIIGVLVIGFGICVIGTTVSYSLNISLWLGLLGVAALYGSFILPPRLLTFLQHRRTLYQEERRKVEEEKREKLKKQQRQEERSGKEAEELAERLRMEIE